MADYDSDSSTAEDIETNVLLGYASKEPTSDNFSQLGGHPTWLDGETAPDGKSVKCQVCNGWMSLLLQINGDLPARFPDHERRLYLWICRRKACWRKEGCVRAMRGTRHATARLNETEEELRQQRSGESSADVTASASATSTKTLDLGSAIFGGKSSSTQSANPFAMTTPSVPQANPFSSPQAGNTSNPFANITSPTTKSSEQSAAINSLPETFAQKARLAGPDNVTSPPLVAGPVEPWPDMAVFTQPFPQYHLDADKEYIDPEHYALPSNARLDRDGVDGESGSSAADEKAAFESTMDKTFQRFADRLAQNPEQVLRYEFDGQPLLYSRTDAVGKLLAPLAHHSNSKVQMSSDSNVRVAGSRIPRCPNCGAARVFELQMTPHAITELEADDMSLEGMDWGTIILGVCSADCQQRGVSEGHVGYVEEWVGVQWEEIADRRRT